MGLMFLFLFSNPFSNHCLWVRVLVQHRFLCIAAACTVKHVLSVAWHETPTVPGTDTPAHDMFPAPNVVTADRTSDTQTQHCNVETRTRAVRERGEGERGVQLLSQKWVYITHLNDVRGPSTSLVINFRNIQNHRTLAFAQYHEQLQIQVFSLHLLENSSCTVYKTHTHTHKNTALLVALRTEVV